ncbi:Tyrosine recombinase XerC [subsurface metagenome]|nr:tyrosine-type recombinase/integrase [Clostridia bacterium]
MSPTIYKRGNIYWLQWVEDGKQHRESAHTTNKRVAQTFLGEKLYRLSKKKVGLLKDKDFKEFIKEYLEYSKTNKSKSAFDIDQRVLRNFTNLFKIKNLSEVTTSKLEKYKTIRLGQGVSKSTINRELTVLKHTLNKAVEWNYLEDSPGRFVKKFRYEKTNIKIRSLSNQEIDKLLKALETETHKPEAMRQTLKDIILMAVNTGMRLSEVLNVKWEDLDMKNRIVQTKTIKGGRLRIRKIPLNRCCYDIITTSRKVGEYIFSPKKKPITRDYVTHTFLKLVRKSRITPACFNDLRHTFASHLGEAGADERTIAELLGHSSTRMTWIYTHLGREHLRKAVDKLDFSR